MQKYYDHLHRNNINITKLYLMKKYFERVWYIDFYQGFNFMIKLSFTYMWLSFKKMYLFKEEFLIFDLLIRNIDMNNS